MRRASWILGSLTALTLAACGGGNRQEGTTAGTGSESGAMSGDTTTLAPGAATMDTAMTGTDTTAVPGSTHDTAQSH
jgi:uncharacterized lipoprotein